MINISDIEITKKFTATYGTMKAIICYRIDEDWFSVYYYQSERFLMKDVKHCISEQNIIDIVSRKMRTLKT